MKTGSRYTTGIYRPTGYEIFGYTLSTPSCAIGGAATWAAWAMAHRKLWLSGPQCIYFLPTKNRPVCSLVLRMSDFKAKMHQIRFPLGLSSRPS